MYDNIAVRIKMLLFSLAGVNVLIFHPMVYRKVARGMMLLPRQEGPISRVAFRYGLG